MMKPLHETAAQVRKPKTIKSRPISLVLAFDELIIKLVPRNFSQ